MKTYSICSASFNSKGEFQMAFFCALEGHFGKGMPFVGTFQTKVDNRFPLRRALPEVR